MTLLVGVFDRLGVLAYRDYSESEDDRIEWSGWMDATAGDKSDQDTISQDSLIAHAAQLLPIGGGDWPEATKTALAKAYQVMRPEAHTIVLFFTDAPPHFPPYIQRNPQHELEALAGDTYGEHSGLFADWATACNTLASGGPEGKVATVLSFVGSSQAHTYSSYLYLSALTRGVCLCLDTSDSASISQITMGTLLAWAGVSKAGVDKAGNQPQTEHLAELMTYTSDDLVIPVEDQSKLGKVVCVGRAPPNESTVLRHVKSQPIAVDDLSTAVPVGYKGQVLDFDKRYKSDPDYRALVQKQLGSIIATDVNSLTVNPLFGSLWRAVTADRDAPARDALAQQFSAQVAQTSSVEAKARLSEWLAESYNFASEISEYIDEVPERRRFPCVLLDPTQDFTPEIGDDDDDRRLDQFTRDELLEIGRSCDGRVLRRLGKVLTRLTYVEREEDLPAHLVDDEQVPRLPLALAEDDHKGRFWSVLLHLVLAGTKLSTRPAALLAALSLRIGILPLREIAYRELFRQRAFWNNIDVHENWNSACLGLLLDADADFEHRVAIGEVKRSNDDELILLPDDRSLFQALVKYKTLERNLATTLVARVGWTPEKTTAPIGPLVVCRVCKFPRSVTMMASKGICGLCCKSCDCASCTARNGGEVSPEALCTNVSADASPTSPATWVECSLKTCRAQYVVYNPDDLVIRPKCFDCRHLQASQGLECKTCKNRIVFPLEYRPKDTSGNPVTGWECSACTGTIATIVNTETCAAALRRENGNDWLVGGLDAFNGTLFNGRSLFVTATNIDRHTFATQSLLLPKVDNLRFNLHGKQVHNAQDLVDSLSRWVNSRRAEQGSCSLCIGDMRKDALVRACGRKGCEQLICAPCRRQWYGINQVGRVINVAALHCPFCRRLPAPNAVSEFGLVRLGDLRRAVDEAGAWIYAWCRDCRFARQYVERECARGAPRVSEWQCEPCVEAEEEARILAAQRQAWTRPPVLLEPATRATRAPPESAEELYRKARECPGCKFPTVKASGCDHITCPCGTHWCWACGEEQDDADATYRHMAAEHGGLWDDGEEDDWEQ